MTGSRNYPVPKHREDRTRPEHIAVCRCITGPLAVSYAGSPFGVPFFRGDISNISWSGLSFWVQAVHPKEQDAQIHDRSFCAVLEITLANQKSLAYFFLCRRILYDIP